MRKNTSSGFTMIELITAMAVMAVLLGIGIPSFTSVLKNSRMSTTTRALIGSLYIARSEAIKSGSSVTVCARETDTKCGDDWKKGWIVFVDSVDPDSETTAVISTGDEILDLHPPLEGNLLSSVASSDGTLSSKTVRNFVRYTSRGNTNWRNGYFTLCDDRKEKYGRSVNIVLTGDIRPGRKDPDSGLPMDVFKKDIVCGT